MTLNQHHDRSSVFLFSARNAFITVLAGINFLFNICYLTLVFHNSCLTCIFEFIQQTNEISEDLNIVPGIHEETLN